MLKQDLIARNPLKLLSSDGEEILAPGTMGAVLARAGLGKTALIVQIALNSMLQQKNVLHISLHEPVGKVGLWYKEVLGCLAQQYQVTPIKQLWESIAPHRFIMTFRVEGFSVPKLEERLTDLTTQQIFIPQMILIDGLPFDDGVRAEVEALKKMAEHQNVPIWFTVTTHRHEAPAEDGLPIQFHPVKDLFALAISLQPVDDTIRVNVLKGSASAQAHSPLVLDPASMLIRSCA